MMKRRSRVVSVESRSNAKIIEIFISKKKSQKSDIFAVIIVHDMTCNLSCVVASRDIVCV